MQSKKIKELEERVLSLEGAVEAQFDLYNDLFSKYNDLLRMTTEMAKLVETVAVAGSKQAETVLILQKNMTILAENYKKLISQMMRSEDLLDDSNIKSTRIH